MIQIRDREFGVVSGDADHPVDVAALHHSLRMSGLPALQDDLHFGGIRERTNPGFRQNHLDHRLDSYRFEVVSPKNNFLDILPGGCWFESVQFDENMFLRLQI